ncbi:MAG: STAS domain-containing protein [Candidatus Bathyarchaeia archaeon]
MEKGSIPILRSGDCLIASPQNALHDKLAVQFKGELLQKIVTTKAKGLVLDLSAIDIVDSFLVRQIGEIATSAKIMGAKVALVGLRPTVAMTLVEMGISLTGMQVARDLEKGLALINRAEH